MYMDIWSITYSTNSLASCVLVLVTGPAAVKAAVIAWLPDKELEYCRAKAHTWVTNADTFLLSVDKNDLKARPKNTEDLKSSAAHSIRSMETQPEDARSAIYKDKNGITLACVLAWRVPGCPKLTDVENGPAAQTRSGHGVPSQCRVLPERMPVAVKETDNREMEMGTRDTRDVSYNHSRREPENGPATQVPSAGGEGTMSPSNGNFSSENRHASSSDSSGKDGDRHNKTSNMREEKCRDAPTYHMTDGTEWSFFIPWDKKHNYELSDREEWTSWMEWSEHKTV
ncbi:hypothetical protein B0H13DRAFT_1852316 [Mycena leptocephala]|nr:hypothetical protein B0H13DRAFT_1852316 [Mycena leptocephala]